jgi:hypothetical protein
LEFDHEAVSPLNDYLVILDDPSGGGELLKHDLSEGHLAIPRSGSSELIQ